MITAEDARYIVRDLDPEPILRRCWRAADEDTDAVVVLDMATGALVLHTSPAEAKPPVRGGENEILLAWCFACQFAEAERRAAEFSEVPPSREVVEESAVRARPRHAVADWAIEDQLKRFEANAREER